MSLVKNIYMERSMSLVKLMLTENGNPIRGCPDN